MVIDRIQRWGGGPSFMKKRLRQVRSAIPGLLLALWVAAGSAFAAHPLITEDTDTQGAGKSQIEISSQWSFNKESDDASGTNVTTRTREGEVKFQYAYGVTERADLILGVPCQWKKTETDDVTSSDVSGGADLSLEVKWRFYEKDSLSLALKPGLTLPSGDRDKGLGTGRVTGTLFFITTKDWEAWTAHVNLGYKRFENKLDQREDIWHASVAAEWKVMKVLRIVANIGSERNSDPASQTNPAFALGGFIYSVSKNIDLDAGFKRGLNRTEKDDTFLCGLTFRF
jgi:hypothetical protein